MRAYQGLNGIVFVVTEWNIVLKFYPTVGCRIDPILVYEETLINLGYERIDITPELQRRINKAVQSDKYKLIQLEEMEW
tara:strand:+ start:1020 stop:1256 length:237 start_codon:yes stop_codon:yes gene_type:complete